MKASTFHAVIQTRQTDKNQTHYSKNLSPHSNYMRIDHYTLYVTSNNRIKYTSESIIYSILRPRPLLMINSETCSGNKRAHFIHSLFECYDATSTRRASSTHRRVVIKQNQTKTKQTLLLHSV